MNNFTEFFQTHYSIIFLNIILLVLGIKLMKFYELYALKKNILALPGNRTLHNSSTPRGGGIVFSILFILGICTLFFLDSINFQALMVFGVGCFIAAIFGFIDDMIDISEVYKLCLQFFLAFWAIYWLNTSVLIEWIPYWLSVLVIAFLLVWMINLYNFMDGIDGMAISGALFISILSAILSLINGGIQLSLILILLASCSLGFIFYNWPPARIFMGDSGSIFLGYFFGALVLKSLIDNDFSIWVWIIIFSYFLVDTTLTLLLRIFIVKKYLPHRSHAYQNLARIWNSHTKVTLLVMAYHFFWILPLSILATMNSNLEIISALLAIFPVILITIKYGPIFSSA